jgi:hypothetical protein
VEGKKKGAIHSVPSVDQWPRPEIPPLSGRKGQKEMCPRRRERSYFYDYFLPFFLRSIHFPAASGGFLEKEEEIQLSRRVISHTIPFFRGCRTQLKRADWTIKGRPKRRCHKRLELALTAGHKTLIHAPNRKVLLIAL